MRLFFLLLILHFQLEGIPGQQCQNDSTGLIPLMDLGTNLFNDMQGGLYGKGENAMPESHLAAGLQIAAEIQPLNPGGIYAADGKIGFVSIGMSNANQFFTGLRDSAMAFPHLNSKLTLVNGAAGGFDIDAMLYPNSHYWTLLDQKLSAAEMTNQQVQVIWFMQAKHISGIPQNEGLEHIQIMESKFLQTFEYLKIRFPNLKQIFCSGRDYGGYSQPGSGNPEPYAYYTNWAFRKLVDRQMSGDTLLNFSGTNPKIAWLAWADNVWADGKNYRSDGFNWTCPDDVQADGVHPNAAGRAKVAGLLFNFFKSDTTTYWFRESTAVPIAEPMPENDQIILFPNPATDYLRIELADNNFHKIKLINLTGAVLADTTHTEISVANFAAGLYFIRIYYADTIRTYKFIKQ